MIKIKCETDFDVAVMYEIFAMAGVTRYYAGKDGHSFFIYTDDSASSDEVSVEISEDWVKGNADEVIQL